MLQKDPERRIGIEEVRGRLEKIDLDKFDLDDEEQIEEKQELVFLSIPLAPFKATPTEKEEKNKEKKTK